MNANSSIFMKFLLLLLLLITTTAFSQKAFLSKSEADKVITPDVKKEFGLEFPVFRVYNYTDKAGKFYIVLTEKNDGTKDSDTLHTKIKAACLKNNAGKLEKSWEINDFVTLVTDADYEQTIWFWTKYSSFIDIDKDGIVEPVIIYGTNGYNGYDDGRIKILIFYKGEKIAIRHQNSVFDEGRNTEVDAKFYKLPESIQNHVKKTMKTIMANNTGIFPNGWEKNMAKHKTAFDEN